METMVIVCRQMRDGTYRPAYSRRGGEKEAQKERFFWRNDPDVRVYLHAHGGLCGYFHCWEVAAEPEACMEGLVS